MLNGRKRWLVLLFLLLCAAFAVYYMRYRAFIDNVPPVLTCDTERITVSVEASEEELLAGVYAKDNRDGDLTSEILIEEISNFSPAGVRTIRYAAVDSANNIGRISRELVYADYRRPHFELTESLIFGMTESYNLLSCITASDVLDGDVTYNIRLTSNGIEYGEAGSYEASFGVSNSAGDYVSLTATVELREKSSQDPSVELTDYLVYLEKGADFDPLTYVESVTDPGLNYGRSSEEQQSSYPMSSLRIDNPVQTNVPGTYEVTYRAPSGNPEYTGINRLIVIVEEDASNG